MPALSGQVVMTLRNGAGATVIQSTTSYNPANGALRDVAVSTSDGTKTGALVVDNATGRPVKVLVTNAAGGTDRTVNVPATGVALTAAQLSAQGVTLQSQLNGLTFDLA